MATAALKGAATITYTPDGGVSTIHTLAVPLLISPNYGFARSKIRRLWQSWTPDGRTRETWELATGADEIVGMIRFDDEPTKLTTLLEEALYNNVTLTYSPDGVATYDCKLVAIEGAEEGSIQLLPDPQRYGFGEYMVAIRLRLVDGSTWDALLE